MFTIKFQDNDTFCICVNTEDTFHVCFGEVTKVTDVDWYEGSYEVTPKIHRSVVLETQGLAMTNNVTVNEITVASVQNPQGGKTVWIGEI